MLYTLTLPWYNCYDTSSIHPWLHFSCTLKSESFHDFNPCFFHSNCNVARPLQSAWANIVLDQYSRHRRRLFLILIFDDLGLRHSKEGVRGQCISCVGLFHVILRFHVGLKWSTRNLNYSWSHFLYTFRGPRKHVMPSKVEVLENFSFFESTFLLGTRLWLQTFFVFTPGEMI